MKLIIRKATIKDLAKIQALNFKLFEKEYKEYDKTLDMNNTYSKKGTEYFINRIKKSDGFAYVAEFDNEIVGYLIGKITKNPVEYRTLKVGAELENMLVLQDYRNLKIGSKLMKEFIKWTKEKKVKNVSVTASAQNLKAINFYRKHGFKDFDLVLERNNKL